MDDPLLAAFEAGRLPAGGFHHSDHVRVAWSYLRTHPPLEAAQRFSDGLKRLARAAGRDGLYHETITCAYLFLIHERMARGATESAASWDAFALANPDLLSWRPSILDRYYRRETLASDLARRVFVLPDSRPR